MPLALPLLSLARAGLIDSLPEADRHMAFCENAASAAEDLHDYAAEVAVWDACRAEAERLQYTALVPVLKARRRIAGAMQDAAAYRERDPQRWASEVLGAAAREYLAEIPAPVKGIWRDWLQTDAGRARLAEVRTVTVYWAKNDDPAFGRRADELMRRYVEDVGLSWADPGSDRVDVILHAKVAATTLSGAELKTVQVRIAVSNLRFRRLDKDGPGFATEARGESPQVAEAREAALRAAAELAAGATLQRVLTIIFPED